MRYIKKNGGGGQGDPPLPVIGLNNFSSNSLKVIIIINSSVSKLPPKIKIITGNGAVFMQGWLSQFNQLNIIPYIQLVINSIYEFELLILATFLDVGSRIFWVKILKILLKTKSMCFV